MPHCQLQSLHLWLSTFCCFFALIVHNSLFYKSFLLYALLLPRIYSMGSYPLLPSFQSLPPPKKGVMFLVRSVCLSVCLFVCLSVGLLTNLWADFDEIFWRGRAWLKDQDIQFWWRSGSRFGSGSPKSKIRILRISGGLCSLSAFLVSLWSCGWPVFTKWVWYVILCDLFWAIMSLLLNGTNVVQQTSNVLQFFYFID